MRPQTARLSSSLMQPQPAISGMVRKQPSHSAVSATMRQIEMQGDGTTGSGRTSRTLS